METGVEIVLSGVKQSVMTDLKKHHISELIGQDNILNNFDKAVEYSIEKLNIQIA